MASREEEHQVAAAVKQRVSGKLRDLWWVFLLRGIFALGVAASALFWPQWTIDLLIKLLGAYFIIDGVASVVSGLRAERKESHLMQAVVSLAAGLALLFWAGVSARLFLVLVGIWAMLQGVGMFLTSRNIERDDEDRRLMSIAGAVVALIGLVFIVWPNTGIVAVSWLIGLGALVVGGLLVYLATRFRRVKRRLDSIGHDS